MFSANRRTFLFMAKKITNTISAEIMDYAELTEEEKQLIDQTKAAVNNAYAPYSEFCVGSVVLLADGTRVQGSNQENAAYPSGLCAERVAIFAAGANHPNTEIKQIGIAAKPKDGDDFVNASSCGNCRQAMLEYQHKQKTPIELLFVQPNNQVMKVLLADLLPFGFGADDLNG